MCPESISAEIHQIRSDSAYRKLAYSQDGELEAKHIFLCLPGLLETKESFHQLINLSSKYEDCCWLSIDYCGRGHSDPLSEDENYSFSKYLSDIEDFIDHLITPSRTASGQKFHLIGTSMGGILAMHLISRYKHKINSLILNDIGLFLHWSALMSLYRHIKESDTDISKLNVDERAIDAVRRRSHFDLPYEFDLLGMIFHPLLQNFNGRIVLLHSDESPICPLAIALQSKTKSAGLAIWTVKNHIHPVYWNESLVNKLGQMLKLPKKVFQPVLVEDKQVSEVMQLSSDLDANLIEEFLINSQTYFESSNDKKLRWFDNLLSCLRIWKRSYS